MDNVLRASHGLLAWNEYGSHEGVPVLYFHGAPGSFIEPEQASRILLELDVRLIVPDRYAYAKLHPKDNITLSDWASAIADLSRFLNLDKFSLIGYSAGGPCAMACAASLAESIEAMTLVSSAAPLDSAAMQQGVNPGFKPLYELCASDYEIAKAEVAKLANTSAALFELMKSVLPAADQRVFASQAFQEHYINNLDVALEHGSDGIANDFRNVALSWPFDIEQISCPVNVWHGYEDQNVGIVVGEYLGDALPNSSRHFLPDAGHFFMFEQWNSILETHLEKVAAHG